MNTFSWLATFLVGLFGGIIAVVTLAYNRLTRLSMLVLEAWSGIDVQLKRRADLIPNLVAVVKQYGVHEKSIFENIARYRAASLSATTIDEKSEAALGLSQALKTLFAVVENYPELKANTNFLDLQKELSALETDIQLARRYYNGTVRNYNTAVSVFPTNILAGIFNFKPRDYFEAEQSERQAPSVSFK